MIQTNRRTTLALLGPPYFSRALRYFRTIQAALSIKIKIVALGFQSRRARWREVGVQSAQIVGSEESHGSGQKSQFRSPPRARSRRLPALVRLDVPSTVPPKMPSPGYPSKARAATRSLRRDEKSWAMGQTSRLTGTAPNRPESQLKRRRPLDNGLPGR